MYSVVKKYCIYQGPCFIGDVLEVQPVEYMVEIISQKMPKANIITRGLHPSLVTAHNLPFDRRINSFSDDFIMLYVSCERDPREFWSITVTKGKKAVLKVLSIEKAKQLFDKLPKKLCSQTFLFNPELFKHQVDMNNQMNSDAKKQRKREREIAEWNAMGPLERMDRIPPWEGWD